MGDLDQALRDYNIAFTIDPSAVEILNDRGVVHRRRKSFDLALADLTRALEIDPKYKLAHLNRGRTFADKGDHDKAIADFDAALAIACPILRRSHAARLEFRGQE